jgi:glutamate-1-semialdehyde aminotransferase/ubiquinone/menaquinone biosynthesis C-methylase UbiE
MTSNDARGNPFETAARDYDLNPYIHPRQLVSGYDGHVVDENGTDYVDYLSAWGANILGYGYRPVARAARRQAKRFFGLGLPYPDFLELMAELGKAIPCAESVRFGKNGSDVTAAAVRLARAVTGRDKILFRGFHGFHDWYMASTDCRGIPTSQRDLVIPIDQFSVEAIERSLHANRGEVACVIVNPITPPIPEANEVRQILDLVHGHGALLVFDEMISGFRVALAGMQEIWGVTPDLACFGKAIANGMPLSVLAGRERWMRSMPSVNYGMTFEGEAVSIASAWATLEEMRRRGVIDRLYALGQQVKRAFSDAAATYEVPAVIDGADPSPAFAFADAGPVSGRAMRWLFVQELVRDGVFTLGSFNLCYRHTRGDVQRLDRSLRKAFGVLRQAIDRGSAAGLLDDRVLTALPQIQTASSWRHVDRKAAATPLRTKPTDTGGGLEYHTAWDEVAATKDGAIAANYPIGANDLALRGWFGDANTLGAAQLCEVGDLDASSRVLEIGCGVCRVGRELAATVGEWHGVDVSDRMLAIARERTQGLSNVSLHRAHAGRIVELSNESFDFAYCTNVLCQLDKEDLVACLAEAWRVLKPGRLAFFDTWNLLHPDSFRIWREIQSRNAGLPKDRLRLQFCTAAELQAYLEDVGFQLVDMSENRVLRALVRKAEPTLHLPDDGKAPFGYVDQPAYEAVVGHLVQVSGWAMDAIEQVEVFIDGKRAIMAEYGLSRPDVAAVFPRYPRAANCGFRAELRLDAEPPGRLPLQVVVTDVGGRTTDLTGGNLGVWVGGGATRQRQQIGV